MPEPNLLIEKLAESLREVPSRADVLAVRQRPVDELESRARGFLSTLGEAMKQPLQRAEWVPQKDRTLVRFPLGARALLHHPSGAMMFHTGLKPMEALFPDSGSPESLKRLVEEVASRTKIREFSKATLRFEHLWQIKAAAASREGKSIKPILCRVVGAYRHFINELPVLGPASVALNVANEGKLESVKFHIRETTGEVIDRPDVLHPEKAARQIALQLVRLLGNTSIDLDKAAKPDWFRFGYFSLPVQKTQQLLAPCYMAAIAIEGQQLAQAYLLTVPATEVAYMPLAWPGSEGPPLKMRQAAEALPVRHKKAVA